MIADYPVYIGGGFSTTAEKLPVINPYTGKAFANTYLAGEPELEEAIKKAKSVEVKLKELPAFKRYEILTQIAREIREKREELALLLCRESGKPLRYALVEVNRAVQTFTIAAEESKRLPKEYLSLDWTEAGLNKEGLVKYFPVGLVAGITPFNFPLNLVAHKVAPAIAAGCPIIIKPASATPLSCIELAKIIDKTELPKGAFSVLPMNREKGNNLVTDERFKLLSFTGSPHVGWKMKREAGKKKVLLELGGNAGVITSASADIDLAVKKCLVGGFAYSGQTCIHVQRIFVHQSVYDEFEKKFIAGLKTIKHGNPEDAATEISVMIDEANSKRVEQWTDDAAADGARILAGGKRDGCYFEPTVISKTNTSMKVEAEEVFGPVVTLNSFKTFKEAVVLINDTAFGLQAGVFTNDIRESDYAFNNIETGGVILNDVPTFRADHMPYGGVKDSGLGREGVKYAIREMMEPRILVKDIT